MSAPVSVVASVVLRVWWNCACLVFYSTSNPCSMICDQGFGATANATVVSFGGVNATVVSSTPTTIVLLTPPMASASSAALAVTMNVTVAGLPQVFHMNRQ